MRRTALVAVACFVAGKLALSWPAWLVLAGGLLFVGMLGVVLLVVTGREARIAEAEARYRDLYDNAPDMFLSVRTRDGVVVRCNEALVRALVVSKDRILGRAITELCVTESIDAVRQALAASALGGQAHDVELALRTENEPLPVSLNVTAVRDDGGSVVEAQLILRDISERKRAQQERDLLVAQLRSLNAELETRVEIRTHELSAMLKERDVLLQEVHHRVKNNLQIIASLIGMQIRRVDQERSRNALEECRTRVQAIALIHEQLYQSHNFAKVPFSAYARRLATNVIGAAAPSAAIVLELAIDDLSLAVDQAIPCGLLLNELITNAVKHAFPGGRRGTIRVELRDMGNDVTLLAIRDDGVGLADNVSVESSRSLGLQLVHTLTEQLQGQLTVSSEHGASFALTFSRRG